MPAPSPVFIAKAFAQDAAGIYRNTIPTAPLTLQRASLNLGFPAQTMTAVAAGGKPMLGPDMNGILYMMSSHTVYQQTGQPYPYSAAVVAALGGYAVGTMLGSVDGSTLWYNALAGNVSDPDANGVGWVAMYAYGSTPITGLIGGVRTLTLVEASKSVIVLTGALVSNQQVVLPTQARRWLIVNATTGAFSVTVKTPTGSGVIVAPGGYAAPTEVWSEGTNIYNVVSPVSLNIDQNPTPLSIAQRTNAGYLLAVYFNQSSALESFAISALFAQTGADGYLRKISLANFAAQVALSQFSGQVTNAQVPQSAVTQHAAALFASPTLTGAPVAPTQAVGTNDTTLATTAFVQSAVGGGPSQTWQDVTGGRGLNTVFTNTTGRPISVNLSVNVLPNQNCSAYVGSVLVGQVGAATPQIAGTISFIVPNGATYTLASGTGVTGLTWAELA
jgi:hypothetical protein